VVQVETLPSSEVDNHGWAELWTTKN
jgi:hypothetical protein